MASKIELPCNADTGVQVDRRAGFWLVRLNRPQQRNALTDDMLNALLQAAADVEADAQARALILAGAGGHFCAGGDFAKFAELMQAPPQPNAEPIAEHNRRFGRVLEALVALPVPTLAVVRGSAFGGGCGLAAVCDRVIAADDARFAMPEITLGIAPAQIAPFIQRRVGAPRARWLMATGARLTADEALRAGLADVVAPVDALAATLTEALRSLCRAEPAALRATLKIAARALTSPLGATLDEAARTFAELLRHGGAREGIAAARAGRAPAWQTELPELPEL